MAGHESYVLGSSDHERARLQYQATMMDPDTRSLLREAGIGAGMRVLDLGSGAGDVAFVAAELVGPTGEVIGIDRDPDQIALAQARADALRTSGGRANVRFLARDLGDFADDLEADTGFDAVIGRYVLVHTPGLDATLDSLAGLVRPGGVMAFHELQCVNGWRLKTAPDDVVPESLLQGLSWLLETVIAVSGASNLVARLPASMARFGPVQSRMSQHAVIGREALRAYFAYVVATFRSALPGMLALGIVKEGDVDPDATLRQIETALARPEAEFAVVDGNPSVLSWVRVG